MILRMVLWAVHRLSLLQTTGRLANCGMTCRSLQDVTVTCAEPFFPLRQLMRSAYLTVDAINVPLFVALLVLEIIMSVFCTYRSVGHYRFLLMSAVGFGPNKYIRQTT